MIGNPNKTAPVSAALAGIPAGLQTRGPWCGRRQLFVKFAVEAETATIYTSAALQGEMKRIVARSTYHSVAIVGRDALAEEEFLYTAFSGGAPLPVMLDHDGQRPEALERLAPSLALIQVSMDGNELPASVECSCRSIEVAAKAGVAHSVAISLAEGMSDAPLLRLVEQIHKASADTQIVVHAAGKDIGEHDRHWIAWLAQSMAVHADVRVLPQWPASPPR